jgi:hypothetical protein
MEVRNIYKTCFSKTAITHYIAAKETATTSLEYENLFKELASVLFEIDNCKDDKELANKFYNNERYPFFSDDHKEFLNQQLSFCGESLLAKTEFREYDLEKFDNLDKYKFL